MHKLINFVCDELEDIEQKASKGELSISDVQYADTLAHLKKNLLKSEEMMEEFDEGYSSERGYSRDGMEMADQLRNLMEDAPDESVRRDIERLLRKVEQM